MNIIVAVYSDWGIGCSGTQQIVLPEDRAYFKKITDGGTVIAGRRTFEDFRSPLPNRKNIILTRDRDFKVDGAITVSSVAELWPVIAHDDPSKVFVIGGESIYKLLLPFCISAHITKIDLAPHSDTFFPNLDTLPNWSLEDSGNTQVSGDVKYSFNIYKNNAVEDSDV